jgi:hypothetical protein
MPAAAQVTGRLTGTVADTSGAPIAGVEVKLLLTGQSRPVLTAVSTSDGIFNFSGIRPETYDVVVEAPGFRKETVRSVKIDPARETALPSIKLEVGALTETIEVNASVQSVQTGNAEITTTVTTEQLRKLPTIDRSPLLLVRTQAGVTNGRGNTIINGQKTSFTNVTLDGINIQDNFLRDNALDFSPNLLLLDQVAEFTVATSNTNSAAGFGASQVTFVTPSGGNTFHGSAYWSNRNYKTSANTWFNNQRGIARPPLNENQIGGAIGGPVIKNKLFFYSNYELFRLRQQASVGRTILTTDARQGIYTYRDTSGVVRKANVLQLAGVSADPKIQQLLQQVPGQEKINNFTLGDSRQDLLRNTGGYSFLTRSNRTRDNILGKVDYNLSTRHVFSGTVAWNRDILDRIDSTVINDYSTVPKVQNSDHRKFLSAAWRWNPVSSLTNELRGGFNLSPALFISSEKPGSYLLGGLIFSNPVNTYLPNGRYTNTYHVSDNANYTRGRHNIQFGFQMQKVRVNSYDSTGTLPVYTLGIGSGNTGLAAAQLPGISAADLSGANNLLANLAGYVTSYTQTFNVTSRTSGYVNGAPKNFNFRLNNYAWYAQDTWKIIPGLSLNLGLRYDYYSPVDERDALFLLPVIQNGDIFGTMFSNATLDFAGSAVGRPWYHRDLNNFAPNVGLAWDLSGSGKTVLRAAYSISYVDDENIQALNNSAVTNKGLVGISSSAGVTGLLRNSPSVAVPTFKVPRTLADNYALDPTAALGLPDPNLRTPYVQQWSIGFQQQIKGAVLEARYVGNHATKQFRAFDLNQIDIQSNGFLADFQRAYNNATLSLAQTGRFDPTYSGAGTQPLTVFPKLPGGGSLTNPANVSLIQTGQVGQLANNYQNTKTNGSVNFYRNPLILGANLMSNYSNARYDALQVDFRKQTNHGLYLQANYTYSKVLSDTVGDGSNRFEPFLDNNNPGAERARTLNDLTHVFKANGAYDLPIGKGHRVDWRPLSRVLSGWTMGSLMIWQSGTPFSILSARDTLNRSGRSTNNTANTTLNKSQLDELLQFRMTGNGPLIVPNSALAPDGRAVGPDGAAPFAGQVFTNPGAGTIGALQRRMFSGPTDFNMDLSLIKQTRITERQSVELRMDAKNIFNHASFWVGTDQNINSTQFGRITSTFYDRRLIQFGLFYRF